MIRGLSVIESYKLLNEGKGNQLSENGLFQASVLGWCTQWLVGYFLVLDDITDNSHTRRGRSCWFRLPKFACALLMLGDEKLADDVKDILLEMGIYFQIQDDYLDCFGDPEISGKDNYGKADPINVNVVKSIYKDLNLQGIFTEYEVDVYKKLTTSIEALPSKSVQAVLKSYLDKIFKRQK
uniref:Uncharacterized protein n=1 Tax=Chenopodium quinoa TaxID=63459 RepID=A0A803LL87_CHEQI